MIKMTDLKELYEKLQLLNTRTYIQSGNVIFNYSGDNSSHELSKKIEKQILEMFGFPISVMTRTEQELISLSDANPYLGEEKFDPAKNAVIFLHEKPNDDQIQKVAEINYPPDKFAISGSEIFIYCPNGFGSTKLYTNFFERKMGVIGTARNWKTITTILNLMGN